MQQHRDDLRRIGLQQLEPDLWKLLRERAHDVGQHVSCLRMRGGDAQSPLGAARIVACEFLQVVDIEHDPLGRLEHDLAGRGESFHPLAVAREDRHAQFFFEVDDCLRDAGLRSVQSARSLRQAELVARGFTQEAKLLQVHAGLQERIRL